MNMSFLKVLYKQKTIFFVFVCILMLTNVAMLFTEHLSAFAKIAFIFIPLGVQLFLLALVKKPGTMFLFLLVKCVIDAFQMVLLKLFGGTAIAVDMFLNLATTSAKESGELLSNIMPTILLLLVIYIPAILLAIKSVRSKEILEQKFRKRTLTVSAVLIVTGVGCIYAAKCGSSGFQAKHDLYPYNVLYNLDFAIKKNNRIQNYLQTSEGFTFEAQRDPQVPEAGKEREIYVLVLGETARAGNWHSYGYERNTTPQTDTISNIIRYRDVLTQSNTTHKIVPLIFTPAEAKNFDIIYRSKSMVTAFKEAGFKTAFLSNQSYKESFTQHYFNEADIKISIKEDNKESYDHQMLPLLEQILAKDTVNNLFIIVHLYGSHFNYHQRYTKEFQRFVPDKAENVSPKNKAELTNSYDNSILSTDNLLAQIIGQVKQTGRTGMMMYLSDHGEDMLDDARGRFLHASPIPTFYQLHIPFFVWMSESYAAQYPDKFRQTSIHSNYPVSNNTVFHSMLDYASIRTGYLDSTLAIGSPKLKIVPREYLNDHDGCTRIENIRFTKYDYREFEKRRIELH